MNKVERMKLRGGGLEVRDALYRAAADGWDSLTDDEVARLRWYGLYTHSARDGFFMQRVKVVQGILSGPQVREIAAITRDFGRDMIDATTRQCFQIHWITLDNVPEMFDRLYRVGMTTTGACGDITRNVVGCPLAGIAHDQLADGYRAANAIHHRFLGNRDYANLPRKYKISVTGCTEDCARGLINDVALTGAVHDDGRRGFNVRVGGGLSSFPRFASWIDVWVPEEHAGWLVEGITGIFRDFGNRKQRGKARLKFLVEEWGPEKFRDELEARLGRELDPGLKTAAGLRGVDHIGVTEQKDGAHSAVGLCVPIGRMSGTELDQVADLAEEYGSGEVRLLHQQNVLIPNVPTARVDELLGESLVSERFQAKPTQFARAMQTCTGKEFCGLAKVHTKDRARELSQYLDQHVADNGHGEVRVHFAGCSSSCAQHQIGDVGIEGVLKKHDGEFIEAMDIRIGGRLGDDPRFGTVVARKIPHWDFFEAVKHVFDLYEEGHAQGETFADFADRTPSEWWEQKLAAWQDARVERELVEA